MTAKLLNALDNYTRACAIPRAIPDLLVWELTKTVATNAATEQLEQTFNRDQLRITLRRIFWPMNWLNWPRANSRLPAVVPWRK